jgi:type II secretory pathway predicted ATPase ExeA
VLAGESQLDVKLGRPQLRKIKQSVAIHCRLDRLKDWEVDSFINYRLRVAGYEREELFTADAIKEVTSYSKGIPRLINMICGNALLIAYAVLAEKVSADMIERAVYDLRLHSEVQAAVRKAATAKPTKKEEERQPA